MSDRIRFYEKTELEQWIAVPRHNIVLVVQKWKDRWQGLVYCKVMSHHWAMLDNFYVLPGFRGYGYDELLVERTA